MKQKIERPLGGVEYLYWLKNISVHTHFVVVAEISGNLPEKILRMALDMTQAKHPMLQIGISFDLKSNIVFRLNNKRKIPLRVVHLPIDPIKNKNCEKAYIIELENEYNTPISTQNAPLIRVALLKHTEYLETLLVSFHHSIADTTSAIYTVRDILEIAGMLLEGKEPQLNPVLPIGPVESHIPPEFLGILGFIKITSYMLRQGLRWSLQRRSKNIQSDADVAPEKCKDRIILCQFDELITRSLVDHARLKKTTVNGVLCAAQLLAISAEYPQYKDIFLCNLSVVSLRNKLQPPIPNEILSAFISMAETFHRITYGIDLWELARNIQQELQRYFDKKIHFLTLPWMAKLLQINKFFFTPNKKGSINFYRIEKKLLPSPSIISNVGQIIIPHSYGTISLDALHFLMPLCGSGYIGSSATTYQKQLKWNFFYTEPSMSQERAVRIAERACLILKQAIQSKIEKNVTHEKS